MTEDTTANESDGQAARDPGQTVPPRVNTAPELIGSWTKADLKIQVAPPFTAAAATGTALVSGVTDPTVLAGGGVGTLGLIFAGKWARLSDDWYTSPSEQMRGWINHLRRDHGADLDVLPDVNGVEDVTDRGFIKLSDGRYVAFICISPRNGMLLTAEERNTIAATLSAAIDEQINDMPFRIYCTTRPTGSESVANRYRERAEDPSTTDEQAAVLRETAEWLTETDDDEWDPREWRQFLVIEASPKEADRDRSVTAGAGGPQTVQPDAPVRSLLRKRVARAGGAIQSVPGLDAEPASPWTALDAVRQYWGRTDPLPTELAADLSAPTPDGEADDRVQRVTAPEHFDIHRGWVDLGDEYARTLWIEQYPREPESLWLAPLARLRGVDLDLCVNASPEHDESVADELRQRIAAIGSEAQDRASAGDVAAGDAESTKEKLIKMRALLRDTAAQPWQISTYVTVRASDQDALDRANDALMAFEDFDSARRAALEERTEEVRDETLAQSPANATTLTPGVSQGKAFRAGSPLTGDVWDQKTDAPKTRRTLGAVLGSMFPFVGVNVQEPEGMDFGRNQENGTLLRLDPFDRGGSPHMMTFGRTRSGKTYACSLAAQRWFLESDDHYLFAVDTQQGFHELTDLCGGKHIPVGTSQAVNPLRMEHAVEMDPQEEFRLTVDETAGIITGLLTADDVPDAGRYTPVLSQAAERTLVDVARIQPDSAATFARGDANLEDLLETLQDMITDANKYTWTDGDNVEHEIHRREVAELLTDLRSFQDNGKYASLIGEDEIGVVDDDVEMGYLDLHSLSGDDAEKSAMLMLMLSQLREKVKRVDGKSIIMLDEAHVLLDRERTAYWLQRAVREFARYDASVWLITQSPKDFISGAGETDARDIIRQQVGLVTAFRSPDVDEDILRSYGMNGPQREFVRNKATRGRSGRGYSECAISAEDIEGWLKVFVKASPTEHDRLATHDETASGAAGAATPSEDAVPDRIEQAQTQAQEGDD